MTVAPLVPFAIPDRVELDGPFAARAREERDRAAGAPASAGAAVGGEDGMPRFDENDLRTVIRERIPEPRSHGVFLPSVIEDAAGE